MRQNETGSRDRTLKKNDEQAFTEAYWIGLEPDPDITVSQWADQYRVLSAKTSAEAGKWDTERTPYLREIMDSLSPGCAATDICFMKGSQIGGPLALDTPIPTIDGWTTMGEIQPGETVFDEKGKPALVTGVSEIFAGRDCFRITFSDGATFIADASHLWTVWDEKKYTARRKRTIRTEELSTSFKTTGAKPRNRYAVDVTRPLDLPDIDLPVAPYSLGMWIGNGHSNCNQISCHRDDAEEVASLIREDGFKALVRVAKWAKGKVADIIIDHLSLMTVPGVCLRGHDSAILGKTSVGKCAECARQRSMKYQYGEPVDPPLPRRERFMEVISRIGLRNAKRIPEVYLRAGAGQRLRLLQGLMDSDGSITKKGRSEFGTTSEALAFQVFELMTSLGLKPSVYPTAAGRRKIGPKVCVTAPGFRLSFHAYRDLPVFRLSRKYDRLPGLNGRRVSETRRRRIISIERVESVPVRCIEVYSENRLFLAGRKMVPTHNTESGNNWIGFIIDVTSGATMAVQPTVELAKRNSKLRIDPMIEDCERLRGKVRDMKSSRKGGPESDTVLLKEFPGGVLVLSGANSAAGLRSLPCRFIFLDEVDAYPTDVDGEGDPIQLAKARTRTFSRRKIFAVSTPTIDGKSRIKQLYDASDQRRFHIPCPRCEHFQALKWENIVWPKGEPQKAAYRCESCRELIQNHEKSDMLPKGRWIAGSPGPDEYAKPIGFHLSALYSPVGWYSWGDAAAEFVEANKSGPEKLKVFVNTILGETWKEKSDAPDWKKLYDRRELYPTGIVPGPVVFLTLGADVQKDRIEWEVVGWGKGKQSWSIDRAVIMGDTSTQAPWDDLDGVIERQYPSTRGADALFPIRMSAIDSGYNTNEVYSYVRQKSPHAVVAVKGVDNAGLMVGSASPVDVTIRGTRLKKGMRVYPLGVGMIKAELYGWLQFEKPKDGDPYPPGYCHFPQYDEEYFHQLTAERLVTHKIKGYNRLVWEKHRDRNEALDLRVYARAAACLVGIDRLRDDEWDELISQVGASGAPIASPPSSPTGEGAPDAPPPPRLPDPTPPQRRKSKWL